MAAAYADGLAVSKRAWVAAPNTAKRDGMRKVSPKPFAESLECKPIFHAVCYKKPQT